VRRRRRQPIELAELLPRLAREAGAERLRRTALESVVRRSLGDWLGRRLLGCRREGAAIELEFAGESAAQQAEALAPELLEALGRRIGGRAPQQLRVVAGPPAKPDASGADEVAPEVVPAPGPEVQAALEGVDEPELRAKLARVAARGTAHRP
jgi:hypothetical protein